MRFITGLIVTGLILTGLTAALSLSASAAAQSPDFADGPLISGHGAHAPVEQTMSLPDSAEFRIAFDTSTPAEDGQANRSLNSLARFLNMHAAAGVDAESMQLALVVHGRAVQDFRASTAGDPHSSATLDLLSALQPYSVRVILCGQSAAYYQVETGDLAPGVEMALSAMTAHALLQQDGYTLNPF